MQIKFILCSERINEGMPTCYPERFLTMRATMRIRPMMMIAPRINMPGGYSPAGSWPAFGREDVRYKDPDGTILRKRQGGKIVNYVF